MQFVISNPAHAKEKIGVENVRFELADGKVLIYYDLIGPRDKLYIVTLTLKRESVQANQIQPKLLTGDIGKGRFAGRNRQIILDISKEYPRALRATDYYFIVEAELVSSRSKSLFWIGAGAILVGGGSAVYLFMLKKDSDAGFPEPPGTPK